MYKALFSILLFLLPWSIKAQYYDHTVDHFGSINWSDELVRVDTFNRNFTNVTSYKDSTIHCISAISDRYGDVQLTLIEETINNSSTGGQNVFNLYLIDSSLSYSQKILLEQNNVVEHTPANIMFVPGKQNGHYLLFISSPYLSYYKSDEKLLTPLYFYSITIDQNKISISDKKFLTTSPAFNVAAVPFHDKSGFWIITQSNDSLIALGLSFEGQITRRFGYFLGDDVPAFELLRTSVSGETIASACGARKGANLQERKILIYRLYGFNTTDGAISSKSKQISLDRYDADYLRLIGTVPIRDLDDLQFWNLSEDTLVTLINPSQQTRAGILFLDFNNDHVYEAYPSGLNFSLASLGSFRRRPNGLLDLSMVEERNRNSSFAVKYHTANIFNVIPNSFQINVSNEINSVFSISSTNWLVESNKLFEYHKLNLNIRQECDSSINFMVEFDTTFFSRFEIVVNQQDTIQEDDLKYYVNQEGWVDLELLAYTPWNYMRKTSKKFLVSSLLFKPSAKLILQDTVGCEWLGFRVENNSKVEFKGTEVVFDLSFGDNRDTTLKIFSYFHHVYDQSGTYPISLIVDDGYCQDTFISLQDVKILEAPKPGLSLSQDTACFPDPVIVSYVHDDLVDSIEYAWGDGFKSTTFNKDAISHAYDKNALENYQIIQKLYGPTGCIIMDSADFKVFEGFPDYPISLRNVSVLDNQNIEVTWNDYQGATAYSLYHEGNLAENLQSDTWVYSLDSIKRSYGFQIQAINHCNTRSSKSAELFTNYLQADVDEQNKYARLFWNTNLPWEDSVGRTGVEVLKQGSYVELSSLDPTDQEYFDYQFSNNSNGLFSCYRIYTEHVANPSLRSYSNTACANLMPFWYIPTAFSPNNDGINDTYSIFTTGIPEVRFSVYNRWGEKIFETDQNEWDGTYQGNVVNSGVYLIKYEIIQNSGVSIYGSEVLTVLE